MAVKVYLTQNNVQDSEQFGRYYAYADNERPITLDGLAAHMTDHHLPYSEGMIAGLLKDAVKCIRELILSGQPVKLDGLAIFSAHIENRGGWAALKDVNLSVGGEDDNIQAIRLSAQATGSFTKAELTSAGTISLNREWRKKVQAAKKAAGMAVDDDDDDENNNTGETTGGNTGETTGGNTGGSTGGNTGGGGDDGGDGGADAN